MSISTHENTSQSLAVMVPTENVLPNPNNPRKNDALDSNSLQKTIRENGWLTPVSAYETEPGSGLYMLIGGHRRLFAAREAKVTEIPVFKVPKPVSPIAEMKQILGLQSDMVDWSQYEYASYVYNLWIELGKPSRKDLAKELGLSANQVTDYINILKYYPRTEIEDGLTKKELTITALAALIKWMKALKEFKPGIVKSFGEDIIRRYMIAKIINKKASRDALRNTDYCKHVSASDIKRMLTDKNIVLDEQVGALSIEKKYKDFSGNMISIGHIRKRIPAIKPETEHQKKSAINTLEVTIKAMEEKLKEIKSLKPLG